MLAKSHNPVALTTGGVWGHYLRRSIHISVIVLPYLYQHYGMRAATYLDVPMRGVVMIIVMAILALELIRLTFRITLLGQRPHELRQLSSFAWSALGIGIVLITVPYHFAVPIVWASALVDPLLGELRRFNCKPWWVALVGLLSIAIIWGVSSDVFNFSCWWLLLMAPITLAVEWPNIPWLDDNFLMLLTPVVVLQLIHLFL